MHANLNLHFSAILLTLSLITSIHALPPSSSSSAQAMSTSPCTNITTLPSYTNYTLPYTCTLKHDYAILGLYYDTCMPLNTTSPTNTSTPNDPPTLFCCDPSFSTPPSFDALCVWGSGINMTQWEDAGHPAGQLPTTSEEQMRDAKCMVGPIIEPVARCVQVGWEGDEEEDGEELGV